MQKPTLVQENNNQAPDDLLKEALQREKQRRKLAEQALETKTREVYQAHQQLKEKYDSLSQKSAEIEFLNGVASFSHNQLNIDESLALFIKEVCKLCRWPVGHIYRLDAKNPNLIRSTKIWHLDSQETFSQFKTVTEQTSFKIGEGLPGRILKTRAPAWIPDVSLDENFPRQEYLTRKKIKSGFGVPILADNRVLAIAEFFAPEIQDENLRIIEIVKTGALQLGTLIERNLSQKRLDRNYKKLEQTLGQLQETQGQLVQSEKMASLGTIAAGVAHEVNNPIGFILSNIGTLSEYTESLIKIIAVYEKLDHEIQTKKDDFYSKTIKEIQALKEKEDFSYIRDDIPNLVNESIDGANRVKDIVQGLKSFSRVDEAEVSDANINECIESTLKVVWNELKYKCELKKELAELPPIKCYPGQLNQVFMNLFVNASHAIEEKGTLEIKSVKRDQNIVVTVSDTGKGIPKENLEKLFNPFFTTKPVGEGTGLGLSISYGIIEKHGGKIEVESEVGKGTTFRIKLPISGIKTDA